MLTAGIVIETLPGNAAEVEHRLALVPQVRVHVSDAAHLSGICTVPPDDTLLGFLESVAERCPGIVSIRPTFVRDH